MANIKDVNVNLRKRFSDDTTLNLYPKTKSSNIVNPDGTTLDDFIEKEKLKNDTYDTMKEKFDSVEYGAKKNQNAFSTVSISGRKVIDAKKEKSDINIIPGDNIDVSEIQGSLKISANMDAITQLATETKNGLMNSSDFKKLQGIEENANNYIHPKSTTFGSFTSVTTDEYGHVISGDTNPLPIVKGGTGVESLDKLKKELNIPSETINEINETSMNAVSSSAVFKALEDKANKNHGKHVPDTPSNVNPLHYLAEDNTWKSLPSASNTTPGVLTIEDVIKYNEEDELNNNTTSASAITVRAVYNFVVEKEKAIIDNAKTYSTFKSIEEYIEEHSTEFKDLQSSITEGDTTTLDSAKEYVNEQINTLLTGTTDNGIIDTFKEIETWVNNHQSLYENLIQSIALKADTSYVDAELGKKVDSTSFTEVTSKISSDFASAISTKVDKVNGKGLSTNDLTNELVSKLNNAYEYSQNSHAPLDAEKNKIVSISRNGSTIEADANRNVNIVVPLKTSELTNDSNFLTEHPSIDKGNDTSSTKTINTSIDDSFTVIDIIQSDKDGHLTSINTKTISIPKREKSEIKELHIGNSDENKITYNGSNEKNILVKQGNDISISFNDGVFTISSTYAHPTGNGNNHIPAGGSSGQVLGWDKTGEAKWIDTVDTTYDVFTGCSVASDGSSGLVPKPNKTDVKKFLSSEGTWELPNNTQYDLASKDESGLMSSSDFTKLSGIDDNANKTIVDTTLNSSSLNPLSNKAIYDELNKKISTDTTRTANTVLAGPNGLSGSATFRKLVEADIPDISKSKITDFPSSMPASDVASWAKAATKPKYTKSEIGLGNVGNFKAVSTVASQGLSTTEKSNARANIGAGTSNFSGSYTDLSNKPTIPTNTTQLTNGSGFITLNTLASATDRNVNFKTVGVGETYYIAGHDIYEIYSSVLTINSAAGVNYNTSKLFKVGNLVMLNLNFTATFSGSDMTFAVIPKGYRPLTTVQQNFVTNNGNHRYIRALPHGELTILGQHTSGDGARLILFWFTEN